MKYLIKEVTDSQTQRDFLECPRIIYRDDPNWVCMLDMELKGIFNPQKNSFFRHGSATRFVLYEKDSGKIVGRIGVFVNLKKAFTFEQPTGGIGFFECINDTNAANILFDTAKNWLTNQKMMAMDGPINFGENDRYWGLLVEGFSQPFLGMQYHLPYYRSHFENYGFTPYFEQKSKVMDISQPPPERFVKIAEWSMGKQHVTFEHPRINNMQKYIQDFAIIYNDAWQHHPNFTAITQTQLDEIIKEMKFVIIEEMISFAYVNGDPAGFLVCLPDLNQIFKSFRGKMGIINTILFLWRKRNNYAYYRKNGILNRGRVMIMGVRPKYQKTGLESGMVIFPMNSVRNLGFKDIELGWVGDFNPSMQALQENASTSEPKLHITYRYLFNDPGKFQYSPKIG